MVEQERLIHILYEEIIRTSNYFLYNCKTFRMEILQSEDPSYAELAKGVRRVGDIIKLLGPGFDPMLEGNASEYCDLMTNIGIAITDGNELKLRRYVSELQRKPGVVYE